MSKRNVTYFGGPIFDGERLLDGHAALFEDGLLAEIRPMGEITGGSETIDLNGDILSPGYVDLQVNGGDGIMFNDDPSVATLRRIAAAHRSLGATRILPTLITDTAEMTRAAVEAAVAAIEAEVPGIAGLHLEGPHLSVKRKGAHDASLIRPMTEEDLSLLIDAAGKLPALMVTIAPENVTTRQVREMAEAGILVSLGHTDAGFSTCLEYADAGACCVTHLFNAMSQLGNREPGVVGAAIADGRLSAGLIADGIHVHSASMATAWSSKTGPGSIFLVSDAMAVAGSSQEEFHLNGRLIQRRNGRLTLEDGTLAGADLDLTTAIRTLCESTQASLVDALAAATVVPARLLGVERDLLAIRKAREADFIRISANRTDVAPLRDI